jgi:hypothetical protein
MDEGVDPKTLSDRLGHSNTSVALQIYPDRSQAGTRSWLKRWAA